MGLGILISMGLTLTILWTRHGCSKGKTMQKKILISTAQAGVLCMLPCCLLPLLARLLSPPLSFPVRLHLIWNWNLYVTEQTEQNSYIRNDRTTDDSTVLPRTTTKKHFIGTQTPQTNIRLNSFWRHRVIWNISYTSVSQYSSGQNTAAQWGSPTVKQH